MSNFIYSKAKVKVFPDPADALYTCNSVICALFYWRKYHFFINFQVSLNKNFHFFLNPDKITIFAADYKDKVKISRAKCTKFRVILRNNGKW